MNKNKFTIMIVGIALATFITGCSQTADTGRNTTTSNTSIENSNNTGAVAVNSAPAPTNISPSPLATAAVADNAARASSANNNARRSSNNNAPKVPMPTPQIGSGANDFFLFTKTRGTLDTDAELKNSNIIIDVKEGALTLTGTVASAPLKAKAEQLVKSVAGVRSVKNQIKVSAGGAKP